MVLLDTCALIWWTLDPDQLSKKATKICSKIDQRGCFISSISIWEIGIKIKNKKLDIGMSIESYVNALKKINLEIIPITEEIWISNLKLNWDNKDPADRTIVTTAKVHKLPIVTKDENIARFYKRVIW
jgi:PIN domain nuclease of toxin-antitoxin system